MRRDLLMVAGVSLLSGGLAVGANLGWHRLDWIRPAPPPSVPRQAGEQGAGGLTAEQVLEHLRTNTAHFVDAREEQAFLDGHLIGAIHLPSSAVYDNIERITTMVPIEEKVIVYCGGGDCEASHTVADVLREFDYADVEVYGKGWEEIEPSDEFADFIVRGQEP